MRRRRRRRRRRRKRRRRRRKRRCQCAKREMSQCCGIKQYTQTEKIQQVGQI